MATTTALKLGQTMIDWFEHARTEDNVSLIVKAIDNLSVVAFYRANLANNDAAEFYKHTRLTFLVHAHKVLDTIEDPDRSDAFRRMVESFEANGELTREMVREFVPAP